MYEEMQGAVKQQGEGAESVLCSVASADGTVFHLLLPEAEDPQAHAFWRDTVKRAARHNVRECALFVRFWPGGG